MPELESLLDRLIQGGVQFSVVGGFAAMAHGVTLLTQDIDICLKLTKENLFCLQPKWRLVFNVRSEHIACAEVFHPMALNQQSGLRPLAGARRTKQQDVQY